MGPADLISFWNQLRFPVRRFLVPVSPAVECATQPRRDSGYTR